jgi:uncharacterized protein YndB with AHSA1/START domain
MEDLIRTLEPGVPADRAFAVFTRQIGQWWPPAFTASGHSLAQVVMTPEKIYEVDLAGNTHDWGTVKVWDPPHRIVLLWTLGLRAEESSEVELRFADEIVSLVHRGLGADRDRFDGVGGWNVILAAYAACL